MSAVLSRCSLLALGFFAATAAQSGEHAKPAKHYKLTHIVAINNAQCAPGFVASTFTRRINASGQVIGYQQCYEASGIPETPFLWNAGWGYLFTPGAGSRLLPALGADSLGTFGRAVNDAGVAVGYEFTQNGVLAPLWLPSGGASYAVEPDPCSFASALADDINDHGSIAAAAQRTSAGCSVAWILKRADGTETQVIGSTGRPDAINDQDVLVGQKLNTAVKWSQTHGMVALAPEGVPGVERLRAFNINNREQVVGEWQHFNDPSDQCLKGADAVFWDSGGNEQTLERLKHDTDAIALGINEQGLIVGNSRSHSGCNTFDPDLQRAVIWHKGRVTDLNKLLDRSDARRIQLIQASDINERGQIAATGFYKNRPLDKCWDFVFNPDTGEAVYDTTLRCVSIHAFLLTPKKD
jgi:uncharacterized membrane protein